MTDKPRKSKRPKAMRVTTDATKAKLPKPKRKSVPKPPRGAVFDLNTGRMTHVLRDDGWTPTPSPKRVQCPRCEKWVRPAPDDIHTCYDAKALREELTTPSPIAGQPLDGIGSQPAPEVRAIPCGEDVNLTGGSVPFVMVDMRGMEPRKGLTYPLHVPPPDTSAYPWPLKLANWVDDRIVAAQRGLSRALSRLAVAIKRLAWKVAP